MVNIGLEADPTDIQSIYYDWLTDNIKEHRDYIDLNKRDANILITGEEEDFIKWRDKTIFLYWQNKVKNIITNLGVTLYEEYQRLNREVNTSIFKLLEKYTNAHDSFMDILKKAMNEYRNLVIRRFNIRPYTSDNSLGLVDIIIKYIVEQI
jgi:superfamily I DNA/RNA helicase